MRERPKGGQVLEGALVILAFLAVPVALVAALRTPLVASVEPFAHALVAAAAVAYCVVIVGLGRLVLAQLRRGTSPVESGPIAWAVIRVATLVLMVAPFLDTTGSPSATHRGSAAVPGSRVTAVVAVASTPARRAVVPRGTERRATHSPRRPRGGHRGTHHGRALATVGSGAMLVALAAELRRRTRTWRRLAVDDDAAVDAETLLLGAGSAPSGLVIAIARGLAAAGRLDDVAHVVVTDGEARLEGDAWRFDPDAPGSDVRCLVVVLGEDGPDTHVAYVPRGAMLRLDGEGARPLLDDALRVAPAIGLGAVVEADPPSLLRALATRHDDDLVVVFGQCDDVAADLCEHCVRVEASSLRPYASVTSTTTTLYDGRRLDRSALRPVVRALLDGNHDRPYVPPPPRQVRPSRGALLIPIEDHGAVVRLLTAVPRVDGLAEPLLASRERRATELVAYLALRAGEPVTGERLRVRVLGTTSSDAAAKTLFNVASSLRRALGDGPFGPRLPPAGQFGRYAVAEDVVCDVAVLEAWVDRARACADEEERMAWLRAGLELIEGEPFATVLEGYDWFLTEGHLTRLQATCEDAACELVDLALERGLVALARLAVERAVLVDPYSERLAAAAQRVAGARQASFEAIDPALRSTVPSAPVVT